jgi:hypothetical protein
MMDSGYTREEALVVLERNKRIEDERIAKKAAKKTEKKASKTA